MESDFICSRLKQPVRPKNLSPRLRQSDQQYTTKQQVRLRLTTKTRTTPKTTTNKTTTIRFNQSTVQKLHNTKATTSSALVQEAATRVSHDTLILSATHLPAQMQDHFIPSGKRSERNTLFYSSICIEQISLANQGPRPKHSGHWGK